VAELFVLVHAPGLGPGYQAPAREAASRGWPVRELPGEHLHMLVRPADVATAIIGLAAETAT
jgi:hypothetical protein